MKKALLITISFLTLFLTTTISNAQHGLVNWISFEEAQELSKTAPKPILIDLYTSWCGWCKHMMRTTYSDPQIAEYINQNFYAIKFDAEGHDTVTYMGKTFVNPSSGNRSRHELVSKVFRTSGFPTTFFASPNFTNIQGASGYLEPNKISPYLVYYKEDLVKDLNLQEFSILFENTFSVDTTSKKSVRWIPIQEALLQKKYIDTTRSKEPIVDKGITPKKKLIFIHSDNSVSSRVMDSTTFFAPNVVDYVNENYYVSKLKINSTETIEFLNQQVSNPNPAAVHPLVNALMDGKTKAPAVVVLDEFNSRITVIPQFLSPNLFEVVAHYFYEEKYKTTPFGDYRQTYEAPSN